MTDTKNIKSYKGILKEYDALTEEVKWHFSKLPQLIHDDYEYEIIIAYLFLKIEQGQNKLLYGALTKKYQLDKDMVNEVLYRQHITREGFQCLYKNVLGEDLPENIINKIKVAENMRDKVLHGKTVEDANLREAMIDCFEYAVMVNEEVNRIAKFKPFGSMTGHKGRGKAVLDKTMTRLVLKGLGFALK